MTTILEWAITLTGLISLLLVAFKALSKEETGLIVILQKVNNIAIKVGSLSAVIFLIYIYYQMSNGILSIKSIGFYVACGSILFSLLKDYKINTQFFDDVGTIITHKTKELQTSVAKQAEKAKQSTTTPDK